MAELLRTEIVDGEEIRYFRSGAVYNYTRKKLIYPAVDNLITSENAIARNRRRQELARAAFIEGANAATAEKMPEFLPAADLAYVHAIGYSTQNKAMNEKDPKQTDAARLALNVGEKIGDTRTVETIGETVHALHIPEPVMQLLQDLKKRLLLETDITRSNNERVAEPIIEGQEVPR